MTYISSISSQAGGLVNKVSMFDKDMIFLVVFGLRGLKHEEEAQKALLCAHCLKETLDDRNIISVSIGVTSGLCLFKWLWKKELVCSFMPVRNLIPGRTYCGVVGHVLRREYTVIGQAVNKVSWIYLSLHAAFFEKV